MARSVGIRSPQKKVHTLNTGERRIAGSRPRESYNHKMNCPKCTTPAAAGATHCKRCGSPLSAKAGAAKTPASSDEIELMPLEESKAPSFSPYEPPPGVGPTPPAPPGAKEGPAGPPGPPVGDYVPRMRGASGAPPKSNLSLIIGGVLAILLVGFIAWRIFRTKNEVISGNPKFQQFVNLGAGQTKVETLQVTGVVNYTLDVEVTEGEMIVGVVQRNPKDSQKIAELKKCDPLKTVKKADKETLSGEFKGKEQWSWVLLNDTKKAARA